MKCICGYAYYFEGSEVNVAKDDTEDEEFIPIGIYGVIERKWGELEKVAIYACPACHTLQVEF